jgi:hypothetical protein
MDNRPFPDLRHIVRDADDERIQVYAEWVSREQWWCGVSRMRWVGWVGVAAAVAGAGGGVDA